MFTRSAPLTRLAVGLAFACGLLLLLAVAVALPLPAAAAPPLSPGNQNLLPGLPGRAQCQDFTQATGARARLCVPRANFTGPLLVYAHGYVAPNRPVGIPEDQMRAAGYSLPDYAGLAGFAFATSSYARNGLAVVPAMRDLVGLVHELTSTRRITPTRVLLVGASEGGLITALLTEQRPDVFDGGLAACGPVGNFNNQTDYFGDFRVAFDYFFPGLMPGKAITVPDSLLGDWDHYYRARIAPVLARPSRAVSVTRLLSVTHAPYDPAVPASKLETIRSLLWYSVYATNDAKATLGGQPYDNHDRVYAGSGDPAVDAALNAGVQRYRADPAARAAVASAYQSTGRLASPLVTLHNQADPIEPYAHEALYAVKVREQGSRGEYADFAVAGYGHCSFPIPDVLAALAKLDALSQLPRPIRPAADAQSTHGMALYLPLTWKRPGT